MNDKDFKLYEKGFYSIQSCVCDYGIYEGDELLTIVNSFENGKLILDILYQDLQHKQWYKREVK